MNSLLLKWLVLLSVNNVTAPYTSVLQAAELVYARYRVILIGLDVSSAGGRRVLLYPRGRKIRSTDVGLVIAKSLEQAEKVSQFGQRQSFLSCSRKHPKGDDDLLDEVCSSAVKLFPDWNLWHSTRQQNARWNALS